MFVSIMARDTDTEEARLDLRLCIWAGRDTASIPRNDKAISSLYAGLFSPRDIQRCNARPVALKSMDYPGLNGHSFTGPREQDF